MLVAMFHPSLTLNLVYATNTHYDSIILRETGRPSPECQTEVIVHLLLRTNTPFPARARRGFTLHSAIRQLAARAQCVYTRRNLSRERIVTIRARAANPCYSYAHPERVKNGCCVCSCGLLSSRRCGTVSTELPVVGPR